MIAERVPMVGPYRLLKLNGSWYFELNPHYRNPSLVKIKKWKLGFLSGEMNSIPENGEIADFIPSMAAPSLARVKARKEYSADKFFEKKNISYNQTSFWIFPTSENFKDAAGRAALAAFMDAATENYVKKNGLIRATGLIPLGIAGHNPERPHVTATSKQKLTTIRVAYLRGSFETFFEDSDLQKKMKAAGIC